MLCFENVTILVYLNDSPLSLCCRIKKLNLGMFVYDEGTSVY